MIQKDAFIAYLTLGDGGLSYSLDAALALVEGGVDLLEIGLPFSDPIADGPVIQRAMQRSLQQGTKGSDFLAFALEFRKHSQIPLVIFSYYNPILTLGDVFLSQAKEAGASGLLIVDLPYEHLSESVLDSILVVTPSTSQDRLEQIAARAQGFIYYACQKGTTGMRQGGLPQQVAQDIRRIKAVSALPVAIGFGIGSKQAAAEALSLADGFVVGSYFVDAMSRKVSPQELTLLAQQLDPRKK